MGKNATNFVRYKQRCEKLSVLKNEIRSKTIRVELCMCAQTGDTDTEWLTMSVLK